MVNVVLNTVRATKPPTLSEQIMTDCCGYHDLLKLMLFCVAGPAESLDDIGHGKISVFRQWRFARRC